MTKRNALQQITVTLFCCLFACTSTRAEAVELDDIVVKTITSLPPIVGDSVTPPDLADKVVVVSFFASWCPPCLLEFKHLNELKTEFQDEDLTIITINVFEQFNDDDTTRLARFIEETKPKFFVLTGSKITRKTFDNVKRIPTLFIFDRSGKPVVHFIHKRGSSKTNANMEDLRTAIVRSLR